MAKPAEILLFDFLAEKFDASASGSVLYELELHDTVHQSITKKQGVRISEANGDLAPGPGGGVKECDVDLILICFAAVEGKDKKQRQEALAAAFDIQMAVAGLLFADPSLGGRVCDLLPRKFGRGFDVLDGKPYAVVNLPLLINPSGARYTE
jgi:hypothetical protein